MTTDSWDNISSVAYSEAKTTCGLDFVVAFPEDQEQNIIFRNALKEKVLKIDIGGIVLALATSFLNFKVSKF